MEGGYSALFFYAKEVNIEQSNLEFFQMGLYAKYHYVANSSKSFVKTKNDTEPDIDFTYVVVAIVFAEQVLKKIKDLRARCILKLKFKGFSSYEIGKKFGLTNRRINQILEEFYTNFKNDFPD